MCKCIYIYVYTSYDSVICFSSCPLTIAKLTSFFSASKPLLLSVCVLNAFVCSEGLLFCLSILSNVNVIVMVITIIVAVVVVVVVIIIDIGIILIGSRSSRSSRTSISSRSSSSSSRRSSSSSSSKYMQSLAMPPLDYTTLLQNARCIRQQHSPRSAWLAASRTSWSRALGLDFTYGDKAVSSP